MSVLAKVKKGITYMPPRVLIYGAHGIGKSSFAAAAPNPVFINTENRLDHINCASLPLVESYEDAMNQLSALASDDHDYKTVVIDTIESLAKHVHAEVAKQEKIEDFEKIGYNKGPKFASRYWADIIAALNYLRSERGMITILVGHDEVRKVNNPPEPTYDQWALRLDPVSASQILDVMDAVLFARRRIRIEEKDLGFNKKKAFAKPLGANGGDRELLTVGGPTCLAKNSYHLPEKIDLSWAAFESGVNTFYGAKS